MIRECAIADRSGHHRNRLSLVGICNCEDCESSLPAVKEKGGPIPRDAMEPRCPRGEVAEEHNFGLSQNFPHRQPTTSSWQIPGERRGKLGLQQTCLRPFASKSADYSVAGPSLTFRALGLSPRVGRSSAPDHMRPSWFVSDAKKTTKGRFPPLARNTTQPTYGVHGFRITGPALPKTTVLAWKEPYCASLPKSSVVVGRSLPNARRHGWLSCPLPLPSSSVKNG
jgi:hypothetical protein